MMECSMALLSFLRLCHYTVSWMEMLLLISAQRDGGKRNGSGTLFDLLQLADAIREALPEDACDAFGTNDTAGPLSELLYVGFWTDRGNADSDALALLARLRKKKIFLSHPDAEDLEALKTP